MWQEKANYLDEQYTGWHVDLTVDDNGGIHIAYYNSAKGDLKYVYLSKYDAEPGNPVVGGMWQEKANYLDEQYTRNKNIVTTNPTYSKEFCYKWDFFCFILYSKISF